MKLQACIKFVYANLDFLKLLYTKLFIKIIILKTFEINSILSMWHLLKFDVNKNNVHCYTSKRSQNSIIITINIYYKIINLELTSYILNEKTMHVICYNIYK